MISNLSGNLILHCVGISHLTYTSSKSAEDFDNRIKPSYSIDFVYDRLINRGCFESLDSLKDKYLRIGNRSFYKHNNQDIRSEVISFMISAQGIRDVFISGKRSGIQIMEIKDFKIINEKFQEYSSWINPEFNNAINL